MSDRRHAGRRRKAMDAWPGKQCQRNLTVARADVGNEIIREPERVAEATALIGSSGRPAGSVGQILVKHGTNAARFFLPLVRFVGQHVLTVNSPIGRKARPKFLVSGAPLIRTKRSDLVAAGIELLPKTAHVHDGFPALDDGRVLQTANVIWCTGFQPPPGLDRPRHLW